MKFREVDRAVTYAQQLDGDGGPVELMNVFTMAPGDVDAFLSAWTADASFTKQQPGFIRTQLHRGTSGSTTFVNFATWESASALRDAFASPDFRKAVARYPDSVEAAPHVLTPIAVAGICTS